MVDEPTKPGFSDKAIDGLTDARRAVESASEQVADVGRHFRESIDAAKKPSSILRILEDSTRAAPLAMLSLAFIAGAIFVRRR